MGKNKKQSSGLGRSLIKDRSGGRNNRNLKESLLHTAEVQDGYDWGRLNLQSVTEQSSFQEFLSTAELAGREFEAEKINVKFVNSKSTVGLLTAQELKAAIENHEKFKTRVKIPRRPSWTSETTPEELDRKEKVTFLEWRRSLAQLQEDHGIVLTPYEKNLEFWRQLWRVVERSDVIVQIVDARNPLLFRCEDLEKYVKEVSNEKVNLILINKSDFLTEHQRELWAEYFSSIDVHVVFFSAYLASEEVTSRSDESSETSTSESGSVKNEQLVKQCISNLENAVQENEGVLNQIIGKIEKMIGQTSLKEECDNILYNSSQLLNSEQLIEVFESIHKGSKVVKDKTTIGLVGYPNVGKSSTINALMHSKKVSVSSTPGKTKHFQTLYLTSDIVLCDCPGLVMPSFVFTKAEMILNGILPIDQMRDHIAPISLITKLIPQHILEDKYGIMLPNSDNKDGPSAEELLSAYAFNRGFMTANGQPDNSRAARYILKDFVNGKLLHCHAPPNILEEEYSIWPEKENHSKNRTLPPRAVRATKLETTMQDIDRVFFESGMGSGLHIKGQRLIKSVSDTGESVSGEKPWKKKKKAKKEKLRRLYAHLDQH